MTGPSFVSESTNSLGAGSPEGARQLPTKRPNRIACLAGWVLLRSDDERTTALGSQAGGGRHSRRRFHRMSFTTAFFENGQPGTHATADVNDAIPDERAPSPGALFAAPTGASRRDRCL